MLANIFRTCQVCWKYKEKTTLYPDGSLLICDDCLELINNSLPSKVKVVKYLYSFRKKGKYPEPTEKSGKWLIFVRRKNVDVVWMKIKKATEEGKLGDVSKVSTISSSRNGKHVICVYTYDYRDKDDVMRIRGELRKLGIKMRIPYKADEDTLRGIYSFNSRGRISKFFC